MKKLTGCLRLDARWQRFCRWLMVKIWYENHCWGIDPFDAYDKEKKESALSLASSKGNAQ